MQGWQCGEHRRCVWRIERVGLGRSGQVGGCGGGCDVEVVVGGVVGGVSCVGLEQEAPLGLVMVLPQESAPSVPERRVRV